jgi:integrase
VDFSRRVLILTKTKTKDREVPMNPEVVKTLFALQSRSNGQEYVFVNERTKTRIKEVKKAFGTALKIAGIKGLVWHDLRATFGTRLGEDGYESMHQSQEVQTRQQALSVSVTGRRTAINGGTQWATRSFKASGSRGYRYGYAAKRAVASYLGSGGLLTTRADSDQNKD